LLGHSVPIKACIQTYIQTNTNKYDRKGNEHTKGVSCSYYLKLPEAAAGNWQEPRGVEVPDTEWGQMVFMRPLARGGKSASIGLTTNTAWTTI
jgi:hypothetical protein